MDLATFKLSLSKISLIPRLCVSAGANAGLHRQVWTYSQWSEHRPGIRSLTGSLNTETENSAVWGFPAGHGHPVRADAGVASPGFTQRQDDLVHTGSNVCCIWSSVPVCVNSWSISTCLIQCDSDKKKKIQNNNLITGSTPKNWDQICFTRG